MRFGDVEVPAELVNAQEIGELVIFVGAGASVGAPSSLPTFWGLTETIRNESQLSELIGDLDGQMLDEVMGRMEQEYDVDVHLRAARIVAGESSTPNDLHYAIADLANSVRPRVVTTNYDRHLSTALGSSTKEYVAPALPVGSDFSGLVYLHGSLVQPPSDLVVTARDFGRAYLTEAWAARFLERMFASYPTLFIGYSHDDLIMKYLARGLGPRVEKRYILTDKPESPDWKQLNIVPIGYSAANGHSALYDAVRRWATQAKSGLLDHQRRIESIVVPLLPQDLSPERASYIESIIGNEKCIKFFCDHARGAEWLDWIAGRSELRRLFDTTTTTSVISWRLANWFARTYITPEMSDRALAVTRAAGGRLGPDLWDAVARQLNSISRAQALPPALLNWIVLLVRDAPDREIGHLEVLLSNTSIPVDREVAIALFSHLTEPQLRVAPYIFGDSRFEVRLRSGDHWLRKAWDNVFKPFLPDVASDLLAVIDQQLRRAHRDISLANGPGSSGDLGTMRGAIVSIAADDFPTPLGLLIDFARDCIETLLDNAGEQAGPQLAAWAGSEVPLLRRLALHGWTYRDDVDSTTKVEWLSSQPWILDYEYESEVLPLLAQVADAATTAVQGVCCTHR
jgi:hypothetical protein